MNKLRYHTEAPPKEDGVLIFASFCLNDDYFDGVLYYDSDRDTWCDAIWDKPVIDESFPGFTQMMWVLLDDIEKCIDLPEGW